MSCADRGTGFFSPRANPPDGGIRALKPPRCDDVKAAAGAFLFSKISARR